MAKRLATRYVKTCLQMTEEEMAKFLAKFKEHEAQFHVKVAGNGNQEMVLSESGAMQDIVMPLEYRDGLYKVTDGAFTFYNQRLAEVMRQMISRFKGSARVHRIYQGYTVVYDYEAGAVKRITEVSPVGERLIYEHRNTAGKLSELYAKRHIEDQIGHIQHKVNGLLDERNRADNERLKKRIDGQLSDLVYELFILEA